MATRSTIAIKNEDGTVKGVYCHFDGYVSNNGKILQKNYKSTRKINSLINLGSMSILHSTVKHTDFYSRDRGEPLEGNRPIESKDYETFLETMEQEYNYLYDVKEKKWSVISGDYNTEIPKSTGLTELVEKCEQKNESVV